MKVQYNTNYEGYKKDIFLYNTIFLIPSIVCSLLLIFLGAYFFFLDEKTQDSTAKFIFLILLIFGVFLLVFLPIFFLMLPFNHKVKGDVTVHIHEKENRFEMNNSVLQMDGKIKSILFLPAFVKFTLEDKSSFLLPKSKINEYDLASLKEMKKKKNS